jgi:hypothetical protein
MGFMVIAVLLMVGLGVAVWWVTRWLQAIDAWQRAVAVLRSERATLERNRATERAAQTPRIQAYRSQRSLRLVEPVQRVNEFKDEQGNEHHQIYFRDVPTNGLPEDLTPRQRRRVTHKRLHLAGVTEDHIYGPEAS